LSIEFRGCIVTGCRVRLMCDDIVSHTCCLAHELSL
jgi:hypothetical protein